MLLCRETDPGTCRRNVRELAERDTAKSRPCRRILIRQVDDRPAVRTDQEALDVSSDGQGAVEPSRRATGQGYFEQLYRLNRVLVGTVYYPVVVGTDLRAGLNIAARDQRSVELGGGPSGQCTWRARSLRPTLGRPYR